MTLFPIARRSDPVTSHEAAKDITASGQRSAMIGLALDVLKRFPGRTAKELEREAGGEDGSIRKRLNDLRHDGRAVAVIVPPKCSITGRSAQRWYLSDQTPLDIVVRPKTRACPHCGGLL